MERSDTSGSWQKKGAPHVIFWLLEQVMNTTKCRHISFYDFIKKSQHVREPLSEYHQTSVLRGFHKLIHWHITAEEK